MATAGSNVSDTRQEVKGHTSSDKQIRVLLVEALFDQLSGIWNLNRRLQSANDSEPAGSCNGTAIFTRREPSVFINDEGKLETASSELVYHEQGYFEMQQTSIQSSSARFPFSRKYVWRLQRADSAQPPVLSIWFTKPGTETIDYLFHKVNVTVDEATGQAAASSVCLQGEACHLCEEDLYSSSYTFDYSSDAGSSQRSVPLVLKLLTALHPSFGGSCGLKLLISNFGNAASSSQSRATEISVRSTQEPHVSSPLQLQFAHPDQIDALARSSSRTVDTGILHSKMDVTLPQPFKDIPRQPLLFGPSPIQALPRISSALGGKVAVYAKRDDCNSGIAYGGNKTRKLEYLIPDAIAQGCDTLVSIGGFQSNHTRQVAGVAAALGLKAKLVQEKWVDWEDPGYAKVGNIQLSRLMSADVRLEMSGFGIEHKETLRQLFDEVVSGGGKPYYIPAGASDHPFGGLGFARWAFEVRQQEQDLGVFFDTIIVCAVTGSTFAGMIAGFKLLEKTGASPSRKVIGIDASAKPKETFDQVLRIAKQTVAKIGLTEDDVQPEDVILDARFHGGIYGIPDESTNYAIRFGASTEAFITDPVYEGKSLAGMMAMIKSGEIPAGSNVLYAHLGGQLALNAYSKLY